MSSAGAITSGAALQAHSNSMPRLLYVISAFCLLVFSILHRRACCRVWPAAAGGAWAPPACALGAPCLKRLASLPLRLLCLSATRRGRLRGRSNHRQQTTPVTKETADTAIRNCQLSIDRHSSSVGIDMSRVHHCIDDAPSLSPAGPLDKIF